MAGFAKSGTRTICHALNDIGINAYHSEDAVVGSDKNSLRNIVQPACKVPPRVNIVTAIALARTAGLPAVAAVEVVGGGGDDGDGSDGNCGCGTSTNSRTTSNHSDK